MKKKIYVAGPYSKGDVAQNVRNAILASDRLLALGYTPYCPHFTHFWHFLCPHEYEVWLDYDNEWLSLCDGLLRLEGESSGSDKEVKLAVKHDIKVFLNIPALHNYFSSEYKETSIIINGKTVKIGEGVRSVTHADVVISLFGKTHAISTDDYSVTYRMSERHVYDEILNLGYNIPIHNGMVFNVVLTDDDSEMKKTPLVHYPDHCMNSLVHIYYFHGTRVLCGAIITHRGSAPFLKKVTLDSDKITCSLCKKRQKEDK